jgi:hypothetical protein
MPDPPQRGATITESVTKNSSITPSENGASEAIASEANASKSSLGEEEESLSILLTRQKEKSSIMLARSHGEIKRQKTDLEKIKAENELLKEVLLVGCGMKFETSDIKEAVQSYISASNKVEQHRFGDETAKQNSSVKSKLKVLPPIAANEDSPETNLKVKPSPPAVPLPKKAVPTRKAVSKKENPDNEEMSERSSEEVIRTERFRIASALLVKNSLVKSKTRKESLPPQLPKPPRPPQEGNAGPKGSSIGSKIRGVIQIRRNQAKEIIKKE